MVVLAIYTFLLLPPGLLLTPSPASDGSVTKLESL